MAVRVVRLGTPRAPREGLRLGTVRRLPRGVRKTDYARLDFFDLWLPELAPSARLFSWARSGELSGARWTRYAEAYRREMQQPSARRLLTLLALLSHDTDFSVGCYCAREDRCHRTILTKLLAEHGAQIEEDMNSRKLRVSIATSPAAVYEFASNPMNLPRWAAGLAGAVKVEFAERNHLGVLDHVVTLPSGQKVMVPLRVNPKGEGSEVVFTLNRTSDMSDAQMEQDAKLVRKDLAALKRVIEG